MEREIYLERKEFELKFQPRHPKAGLLPLEQPGLFISPDSKRHSYPVGHQDLIANQTSIECDLLVTNQFHDGIWLFVDNESDSIRFPGGCITEEDWMQVKKGPYHVLYQCLIRSLIDIHPIIRQDAFSDPLMNSLGEYTRLPNLKDFLNYVISRHGFKFANPGDEPVFFYQYYLYPNSDITGTVRPLDRVRIYALIEVNDPDTQLPALINYMDRRGYYVWYSRRDHKLNRSCRTDRKSMFQSTYNQDIRTSESGVDILDNIFRTEPIFGKLDIY